MTRRAEEPFVQMSTSGPTQARHRLVLAGISVMFVVAGWTVRWRSN